jgi:hypothetical protein
MLSAAGMLSDRDEHDFAQMRSYSAELSSHAPD